MSTMLAVLGVWVGASLVLGGLWALAGTARRRADACVEAQVQLAAREMVEDVQRYLQNTAS